MVLQVVILSRTGPAQSALPLPHGTLGTVALFSLHQLHFRVELPPARQSRVNHVLQVAEGQRGLGDAGRDEDLAVLECAFLVFFGGVGS